jgi:MFS family permease
MVTMPMTVAGSRIGWRAPTVVISCGCVIALLSFGPRSALGQFLTPLSLAGNWGRDVLSLALAIQNLLWGIGQPFAGAVADRFGAPRVLSIGALLYAAGLVLMAYATTPAVLHLSAGVLIGFGLSGCSFNLVIGALGKLLPASWRSFAFGAGTAAGSFGQFLFSPLARALIDAFDWQSALVVFSALMLFILPLSLAFSGHATDSGALSAPRSQSVTQALAEAFGHRICAAGAWLLHLRLPAGVHHRAPARLFNGSRAFYRGGCLDHRRDRSFQYHGLLARRLARGAAS